MTIYAVKNGVVPLKDFYNYEDDEVDMLFHESSEIIYWRKNFPIHHFLTWELKRPKDTDFNCCYIKITKENLDNLINAIKNGYDEFSTEFYRYEFKGRDLDELEAAKEYLSFNYSLYYNPDW